MLYDDRDISAGAKFADADLIGIPHRLVVSAKTVKAGGVEYKKRGEKEEKIVEMEKVIDLFVPGTTMELGDLLGG